MSYTVKQSLCLIVFSLALAAFVTWEQYQFYSAVFMFGAVVAAFLFESIRRAC